MNIQTASEESVLKSLKTDPEFSGLFAPTADEELVAPPSLVSYRLQASESNCGSECGCSAESGKGCDAESGTTSGGSYCPSGKGDCKSGVG
ncbi:MAG: hypothetical protein ABW168_22020 [Sedimenticola sp.]